MGKRAPAGEIAYSPLNTTLAQSVFRGGSTAQKGGAASGPWTGEAAPETPVHDSHPPSIGQIVAMPKRNELGVAPGTTGRSLNREKRVLLTPEEERQVERLVIRMGEQLGCSLKLSHILRACMAVLCQAEKELVDHAAEFRPLRRPANGEAVALAQFEHTLAKLISMALRDAPIVR